MRIFSCHPSIRRFAVFIFMTAGLLTPLSCGAINPELIGTLGGNTAETINPIEGHIAVLLMNNSNMMVEVDTTFTTDEQVSSFFLSAPADDYIATTKTCDNLVSIDITMYRYNFEGDLIEESANLGTLEVGDVIFCGEVIAITATGTPPNFSVEIY
jgi:hypothetical protein